MTLQEILESVKSGSVSVEEAERILKKESYEEMGYAKLDTSRKARTGFAEVIYCSNKADEHLLNIFERLYREDGEVFGTRASQHQYELVKEKFPETEYDPISRILKVEKKDKKRIGKIAVCSAGTADIPVAEEAAQTAEYFGTNVERIYDVGVSGMHRLFSRLETIQSANCVIAVAGMEGALASVMGGPRIIGFHQVKFFILHPFSFIQKRICICGIKRKIFFQIHRTILHSFRLSISVYAKFCRLCRNTVHVPLYFIYFLQITIPGSFLQLI